MAGQLTIDTLKASSGVLATQNGMTGIAKAWVNFNGTGTVAIRSAFNVSSITDNGTGDYTVNFTTAMPDANYSLVVQAGGSAGVPTTKSPESSGSYSTTSARVQTLASGANTDFAYVSVTVNGN